jgi:hypothetical protein
MMTKHTTAAALCLSLTLALPAAIQAQPDLRSQPIKAVAVQSTLEGEVMVVNTDTRLMTIRLPDGSFEVLHIPPEVSRLDRVRIGNQVRLTETTTAVLTLQRGRDAGAMGREATTSVERAPGSSRPAGTMRNTIRLFGQITGIDQSAGTVQVRGAEETRTFEIADKSLLRQLKVGDGVVVTIRDTITGEITVR